MSKTVIMVCAHKRDACLAEPPYLPVQVGRAIAREDLGYTGDDSGENISAKNRNYCELTAQYWAWKNRSDADYIGLCHYRRYFDFGSRSLANVKTRTPAEFLLRHLVPDMDRVFRRYDVVLGRPKYYPYNLYTDYSRQHIREDLDLLRTVLGEKVPGLPARFRSVLFSREPAVAFQYVRDAAGAVRRLFGVVVRPARRGRAPYPDIRRSGAGPCNGIYERAFVECLRAA